jgi:hypothetical protein
MDSVTPVATREFDSDSLIDSDLKAALCSPRRWSMAVQV